MVEVPGYTDVFVAGGGPAGLAAAIALRARGFSVTVADPAKPPIDKTCGEGLMPGALTALHRLGVTLPPCHCFPFRGIRFQGAGARVDADFPNGAGIGIRRTHLHQALADRASAVGATLLWGSTVKGLSDSGVTLGSRSIDCRYVIGADGEGSRIRQWAGLDRMRRNVVRYGFRKHYRMEPWSEYVEIHWQSGCQIYVTPIGPEEICVVVMSRDPRLRVDQALPKFPEPIARLSTAPVVTKERGALSVSRRLSRVHDGRVFLVGDASGSVDAITGEGMRLSFEQALALADALATGRPDAYHLAHGSLARRPALMSALMLSLDHSDWLLRRVLRAFAAEPDLFASQLAMHVGASTPAKFITSSLLPLSFRILTATS